MGTVIKFPRMRKRHEAPARPAGASAVIVILPVVRIERTLETPPGVKTRTARSSSRSMAKSVGKPAGKSAGKSANKAETAKRAMPAPASAQIARRGKRAAPILPTPACGRA